MDTQTEPLRSDGSLALSERENRILAVQSQLQEQLRQAQQDQENMEKHLAQYQDLASTTHGLEEQSLLDSLIYSPQLTQTSGYETPDSSSHSSTHPSSHSSSAYNSSSNTESSSTSSFQSKASSEEHHDQVTEAERHQTERYRTADRIRFDAENTFKRQKEWRRLQLLFDRDDTKYPESFTSRFQQLLDNLVHEFTHKHSDLHPQLEQSEHPEHFLDVPPNSQNHNQNITSAATQEQLPELDPERNREQHHEHEQNRERNQIHDYTQDRERENTHEHAREREEERGR